jgi:hypothetical protein
VLARHVDYDGVVFLEESQSPPSFLAVHAKNSGSNGAQVLHTRTG